MTLKPNTTPQLRQIPEEILDELGVTKTCRHDVRAYLARNSYKLNDSTLRAWCWQYAAIYHYGGVLEPGLLPKQYLRALCSRCRYRVIGALSAGCEDRHSINFTPRGA